MGSGVSHRKAVDEIPCEEEEEDLEARLISYFLSTPSTVFSENCSYITSQCSNSWTTIQSNHLIKEFCDRYFVNLERIDYEAYRLQSPRTRSSLRGNTRTSLLLYIIRFMLSICDTTWKVKKCLRSLGRKHVLYGIDRRHMQSFKAAFIATVMSIPSQFHISETMQCWSSLIDFVTEQMYVKDVKLVAHFTPSDMLEKRLDYVGNKECDTQRTISMRESLSCTSGHDEGTQGLDIGENSSIEDNLINYFLAESAECCQ